MGYQIAFFTTDWNYEIGYSSLLGIRHFLDDFPDTSVSVFDCFGRYGRTNNDRGEFEIFHVPDLHDFDGCVIQSNQILPEAIKKELARRGRGAAIPILSLNDEIDGCMFAGTDNYTAMRQIVEHLVYRHRLTRLSFLCGYAGSHEGQERRRAFADVCREACISENNIRYYDGFWEYDQGADAAEKVLAIRSTSPGEFPEALVCANDDMALGACETFLKAGIRIPEDIIVTGFDNIGTAAAFSPRLTTVARAYDEITRKGLTALRGRIIAGEPGSGRTMSCTREKTPEQTQAGDPISPSSEREMNAPCLPRQIYSVSSPVFSESCGCGTISPEEDARTKRRFFDMNRLMKNYYTRQSDMTAEMFDAETFSQIYRQFEKNADMFGCPHVYLCVASSEIENHAQNSHHENLDEEMALVGIYAADHSANSSESEASAAAAEDNRVSTAAAFHQAGPHHVYTFFPSRQLLPDWAPISTRLAVFYPLHYKEYCFGYIVLDGISPAAGINLVEATFTFIDTAMENVRKKYLLRDLNQKLNGLYVTDSLTGLYNRFGLEETGHRIFGLIADGGGTPEILFLDMDNMKHINDTLGHKTGDRALRAVADLLRHVFRGTENTFLMRYGGDEFVVICPHGMTGGQSAKDAILSAVNEYNRTSGMPFTISLSIGTVLQKEEERQPLGSLIQLADRRMYEEKKRRKAGRQ